MGTQGKEMQGLTRVFGTFLRYVLLAACLFNSAVFLGSAHAAQKKNAKQKEMADTASLQPSDFLASAYFSKDDAKDLQEGVLYRTTLPAVVQQELKRKDGKDIAIFNAEGKPLHFTQRPWVQSLSQATKTITNLFPLWGKEKAAVDELLVSFTVDKNANLIPKFSGSIENTQEGQVLKGYVIPLDLGSRSVESISFVWEKKEEATVQFQIQTGSDLQNWRTVVPKASLVRFDGPKGVLESSVIDLHGATLGKYLRLVFCDKAEPAQIDSVTLTFWSAQKQTKTIQNISSSFIAEEKATTKRTARPTALEYTLAQGNESNGGLTLASLQMQGVSPGFFAPMKIFTRKTTHDGWSFQGKHTFFSLVSGGETIVSRPFILSGVFAGQIRLESIDANVAVPESLTLSVEYIPCDIYFLAQGKSPYRLYWHGERKGALDSESTRDFFTGIPAEQVEISGVIAREEYQADPAFYKGKENGDNSRKFLLWGILGLGVLMLGAMAFSVGCSIKKDKR